MTLAVAAVRSAESASLPDPPIRAGVRRDRLKPPPLHA